MKTIQWSEVMDAAAHAGSRLRGMMPSDCRALKLFPVPRGGMVPAMLVRQYLIDNGVACVLATNPGLADAFVDDLIDSGDTMRRYKNAYPRRPFVALFNKREMDADAGRREWLEFPWEANDPTRPAPTDLASGHDIFTRLLQFVEEDPTREGLLETPARAAAAWKYWTQGYDQCPADVVKVFADGGEGYDEMVVERDIPVYTHCEHHLAPFFGTASIAYIPNGKVIGLSKLNRIVEVFMRRLQVQERLTTQIASSIDELLAPRGVGVVLRCRHMCVESRGVRHGGTSTVTSALHGVLKTDQQARAEFFKLIEGK